MKRPIFCWPILEAGCSSDTADVSVRLDATPLQRARSPAKPGGCWTRPRRCVATTIVARTSQSNTLRGAFDSSAIDVGHLDRARVQSSVARHLGIAANDHRTDAAEAGAGIAGLDFAVRTWCDVRLDVVTGLNDHIIAHPCWCKDVHPITSISRRWCLSHANQTPDVTASTMRPILKTERSAPRHPIRIRLDCRAWVSGASRYRSTLLEARRTTTPSLHSIYRPTGVGSGMRRRGPAPGPAARATSDRDPRRAGSPGSPWDGSRRRHGLQQ